MTLGSGERQQGVGRGRGFRGVGRTDNRPPGVASRGRSTTISRIKSIENPALGEGLSGNNGGEANRIPLSRLRPLLLPGSCYLCQKSKLLFILHVFFFSWYRVEENTLSLYSHVAKCCSLSQCRACKNLHERNLPSHWRLGLTPGL